MGAGELGIRRSGDALLAPMFRLLYYLYARRLIREVKGRPKPRNVGIILDGNRRHGRTLGITEPREVLEYDYGGEVVVIALSRAFGTVSAPLASWSRVAGFLPTDGL